MCLEKAAQESSGWDLKSQSTSRGPGDAEKVGVVQLSAGGMHVAALTFDGKVLTWGVNDNYALGRDTPWEGGLIMSTGYIYAILAGSGLVEICKKR